MIQIETHNWAQDILAALDVPAIQKIQALSNQFLNGVTKALQQEHALLQDVIPQDLNSLMSSRVLDWSNVIQREFSYLKKGQELYRLSNTAEYVAADISKYPENTAEEAVLLSEDEQHTVADEIETIMSSKKNWEQRFMDSIDKFKETHPLIAWILCNIFLTILIGIIINLVSNTIGQALVPAKVYEEPTTSSPIIGHVEQEKTIIIVGDVPYYYEIEINSGAAEQTMTGYISKKSVRVMGLPE